jgi:UPF0716 protein FxsA
MNPWVILAVLVYPVTEWLAASALASHIGWGSVLLLVAVLMILGAAVMRRAGFAAVRSLRPVQVDGSTVIPGATDQRLAQAGRDAGDAGALFVAGLLIALPGLVTSAAGLVLLVPPVRRAVRRGFTRSVRRRAEAAGLVFDARVTGTTVQGALVRDDAASSGPGQAPDRTPVRGEIVSGEVISGRIVEPDEGPETPHPL